MIARCRPFVGLVALDVLLLFVSFHIVSIRLDLRTPILSYVRSCTNLQLGVVYEYASECEMTKIFMFICKNCTGIYRAHDMYVCSYTQHHVFNFRTSSQHDVGIHEAYGLPLYASAR